MVRNKRRKVDECGPSPHPLVPKSGILFCSNHLAVKKNYWLIDITLTSGVNNFDETHAVIDHKLLSVGILNRRIISLVGHR